METKKTDFEQKIEFIVADKVQPISACKSRIAELREEASGYRQQALDLSMEAKGIEIDIVDALAAGKPTAQLLNKLEKIQKDSRRAEEMAAKLVNEVIPEIEKRMAILQSKANVDVSNAVALTNKEYSKELSELFCRIIDLQTEWQTVCENAKKQTGASGIYPTKEHRLRIIEALKKYPRTEYITIKRRIESLFGDFAAAKWF